MWYRVLLLVALIFPALPLLANDNEVNVVAGSASALMKEVEASTIIDMSATMVVEYEDEHINPSVPAVPLQDFLKGKGDEFVADFPEVVKNAEEYFAIRIKQKVTNKGGVRTMDISSHPQYQFRIFVKNYDYGNAAGSFTPFAGVRAGGAIISGRVEFVNLTTGMAECVFEVPFYKAVSSPSDKIRLALVMNGVASDIAKLARSGVSAGPSVPATAIGGSATATATPAPAPAPAPVAQPQTAPSDVLGYYKVKSSSLKLRQKPYPTGLDLSDTQPQGAIVTNIAGGAPGQKWLYVRTSSGKVGYMLAQYLQKVDDAPAAPAAAPAVAPTPAPAPAPAPSQTITSDVVNLKNGNKVSGSIDVYVPSEAVNIRTADGNKWVFQLTDILSLDHPADRLYVVSLKNGSEISGYIVEQVVGSKVVVRTADGNTWTFKESEVAKISHASQRSVLRPARQRSQDNKSSNDGSQSTKRRNPFLKQQQ